MSRFSNYFCAIVVIVLVIIEVIISFSDGENFWIFLIFIIVSLFIFLIYHFITKDELSKKWEMLRK